MITNCTLCGRDTKNKSGICHTCNQGGNATRHLPDSESVTERGLETLDALHEYEWRETEGWYEDNDPDFRQYNEQGDAIIRTPASNRIKNMDE